MQYLTELYRKLSVLLKNTEYATRELSIALRMICNEFLVAAQHINSRECMER